MTESARRISRLETWRDTADDQECFAGDPVLLDREIAACSKLRDRSVELLAASGYDKE